MSTKISAIKGLEEFEFISSPAVKEAERGRPKGGLLIAINTLVYKSEIIIIKENFIFVLLVEKNFKMIIGLCYCSPLADFRSFMLSLNETLTLISIKFPNVLIFVGGDFNARVGDLNSFDQEVTEGLENLYAKRETLDGEKKKRGAELAECLEGHNFVLLNGRTLSDCPAQYTFYSSNGCSVIDLVWCNLDCCEQVKDLKVEEDFIASDHFPVRVSLTNFIEKENDANETYKWTDNKKVLYQTRMQETLNFNKMKETVENASEHLIFCLKESANVSQMRYKGKKN